MATGLGWFSIALGMAEVAAPRRVARLIGAPEGETTDALLRFYGARELAAGFGILSQRQPATWLWGRVGGDILDLATLGAAMSGQNADRTRLATAAGAVLGVAALDIVCASKMGALPENRQMRERRDPTDVTASITVNRPVHEVYGFWRNLENLPRFMKNIDSVRDLGGNRSHWVAKGPGGKRLEWEAEMVDDTANARIAWQSLPHADVHNRGSVRFEEAAGRRGTIVRIRMQYDPPGGRLGAIAAKFMLNDAEQLANEDLRRFKQVMEIGEVVQSGASIHKAMHPARPRKSRVPEMAYEGAQR